MPIVSKKEYIQQKYEELKEKLRLYVNDDSLFPSLNEYDILDIISFINLYFPKGVNHNETIINLMKENEIELSQNDYYIVSSLIINFVELLEKI